MNIYRRLVTFFAAIIIIFFAVGFALPKEIEVEKTIRIDAPLDSIFLNVSDLQKFSEWIPAIKNDPNTNKNFEGNLGEEGSVFEWEGNGSVGAGNMKILSVIKNEQINIELNYIKPMKNKLIFQFYFDQLKENAQITWIYKQKLFVPKNVFAMLFGLKQSLAVQVEKGLKELKTYSEK